MENINIYNFVCQWGNLIAILAATLTIIGYFRSIIGGVESRLEKRIDDLTNEVREDIRETRQRTDILNQTYQQEFQENRQRTDQLYQTFQQGLQESGQRTDQLYTMFIDLLKEQQKPKTNP